MALSSSRTRPHGVVSTDSVDEYEDTKEEEHSDATRSFVLWSIILENVSCNLSASLEAVIEMSNPYIYMMLGMSKVHIVNDLLFLDYLTDEDCAFTYMVYVFQQFVYTRKPLEGAQHMQLPSNIWSREYWQDLLSNAGDTHHPIDVLTFFRYELNRSGNYGYPSRALHQFDICLPLHVIFFLLEEATVVPCATTHPFAVEFHTAIPMYLIEYSRPRFEEVLRDLSLIHI